MTHAQTLNQKLAAYRAQNRLSLREMAELLKISSGSTIKSWEDGAEIPGPPTLLLELLLEGKMPFQGLAVPPEIRDSMLKVEMNLGAFERLDALRIAGGYASMTDFIASLLQDELNQSRPGADKGWSEADTRTRGEGKVDEVALLADLTPGDAAGGGDAVGVHTDAAAEVFAKKNPLPPAGAAGAPAGTTAGRRDVIYKRPQGRSGTGAKRK